MLLIIFCALFWLETKFPRYRWLFRIKVRSVYTNFCLFLFNNVVLSILSISTLFVVADNFSNQGLLNHLRNPVGYLLLLFILLDLIAYLWHMACHKFDFLWMFNKVHHSNQFLNVSTAFRLHIVEIAMYTLVKMFAIICLGIDKSTSLTIEVVTTLFIMFHHTNVAFHGEKLLSRLIIVPTLHRVHHYNRTK
ncbi:MAG TPA: sterol desaturase family protein [Crenotrichaceae bacterium]|nr:sterol desaturase family protein [Crenotrichaceae bacterium]